MPNGKKIPRDLPPEGAPLPQQQQDPYFLDEWQPNIMPQAYPRMEADLIEKTDPKVVVDNIEHFLAGEEYDEENLKWKETKIPLMNKQGVKSIMTDIRAVVNQNTILSNLDEKEINTIIIQLSDTIIIKLMQSWKEFEVSKPELNTIVLSILHMAYPALKRAWQQGERNWHKTVTRAELQTIIREQPPPRREEGRRRSFLGRMFK